MSIVTENTSILDFVSSRSGARDAPIQGINILF